MNSVKIEDLIDEDQILVLNMLEDQKKTISHLGANSNTYKMKWQQDLEGIKWQQIDQLPEKIKGVALNNSHVNDQNIESLANSDALIDNIKHLYLGGNQLSYAGIAKILRMNRPNLIELYLYSNRLGDEGVTKIMTEHPQLRLQNIGIGSNKITWIGIKSISSSKISCNLKSLQLLYNNIGCLGAKWLTKTNLPLLEQLRMSDCYIGSEGIRYLTKAKFPNLHHIDISYNQMLDNSYHVLTCFNLSKLSYIGLGSMLLIQLQWMSAMQFQQTTELSFMTQYCDFSARAKNTLYYRYTKFYQKKD